MAPYLNQFGQQMMHPQLGLPLFMDTSNKMVVYKSKLGNYEPYQPMTTVQPGMMQGQPGMMQGQPRMMQGQPGMKQGQPGMMQGQPGMMQGQPGMDMTSAMSGASVVAASMQQVDYGGMANSGMGMAGQGFNAMQGIPIDTHTLPLQ